MHCPFPGYTLSLRGIEIAVVFRFVFLSKIIHISLKLYNRVSC